MNEMKAANSAVSDTIAGTVPGARSTVLEPAHTSPTPSERRASMGSVSLNRPTARHIANDATAHTPNTYSHGPKTRIPDDRSVPASAPAGTRP